MLTYFVNRPDPKTREELSEPFDRLDDAQSRWDELRAEGVRNAWVELFA